MKYTAMDVKEVKRSINLIYNHLDLVNMYKLGDDLHNVLRFLDSRLKEAEDDERAESEAVKSESQGILVFRHGEKNDLCQW